MASLDLTSLEIMASGLGYPEGPIHCSDGSVLLVEIKGEQLTLVPADGGAPKRVATVAGGPNGAAIGPNNAVYICNDGGFDWIPINLPTGQSLAIGGNQPANFAGGSLQKYTLATQTLSTLYTACSSRESPPGTPQADWSPAYPLCGPDDLVVDETGGIWFSDWGKMRERDKDITGIYYAAADGSSIRQVVYPLNNPNGIALSPDGKRLYVALTFERKIVYYDVVAPGVIKANSVSGPAQGTLDGSHLLTADFIGQSVLDSMAIDCEGNLYVATMLPDGNNPMTNGGISIVTPSGEVSYFPICLPNHDFAPLPSNICFGGPDMKTVYITCGASGYLLKAKSEVAGLKLHFNGSHFDATTLTG